MVCSTTGRALVFASAIVLTVSCAGSRHDPTDAGAIPVVTTSKTATTTTMPPASTTTSTIAPTTTLPASTPYMVPLADASAAGWGPTHAGYPATDIFVDCGAEVVSPVNGVAIEVRTVDSWEPATDNPATRGGRSVAVLGDDGVRYYVAHLDQVDGVLAAGERVSIGQRLGTVGRTGRSSACHLHVAISPPCPGKEWSVRRGVVRPAPYLDAWRTGNQMSPAAEVEQWLADNPTACTDAMNDPDAADA